MNILNLENNIEDIIEKAVDVLNSGGILIYPTETTYGMGVDAENPEAVQKLLLYKEKREGKPLSIAVCNKEMAEKYVELNDTAENIYNQFLPGPVTVISKSTGIAAKGIESINHSIGIRIPNYNLILQIIEKFGRGITATSANASGGKRPYKIEDILDNISERQKGLIDCIINVGELPYNSPSTVIDTISGSIETVRSGDTRFDLNKHIISNSEEETVILGEKLGKYILLNQNERPIIIAIQGDLGAGKTHFAAGLARGLGIINLVKSPTFNLCNEYKFRNKDSNFVFFHIDTYRMNNENELLDMGFNDMVKSQNVILIEWANRVLPVLDHSKEICYFIWLRFDYIDETTRKIYYSNDILD
ncbi:MAG: L-threonylcarbamoyladenylate synthase [bacterium]